MPLYCARERPVAERNGALIMVDDECMPLQPGERSIMRRIRFATLGRYPLTETIESEAGSVADIVYEISAATFSERQSHVIDHDRVASMEKQKRDGRF